jgi:hypothetical protein
MIFHTKLIKINKIIFHTGATRQRERWSYSGHGHCLPTPQANTQSEVCMKTFFKILLQWPQKYF